MPIELGEHKIVDGSIAAESAVLGCVLLDDSCLLEFIDKGLTPDDFAGTNREIFEAMLTVQKAGAVDAITVHPELVARGVTEDDAAAYLEERMAAVPNHYDVDAYVQTVINHGRARRVKRLCRDVASGRVGVNNVEARLRDGLEGLAPLERRKAELPQPVDFDAKSELREQIIQDVLRRGETANIIGAAKVGKSWLAYQLALCVASGRQFLGEFPVKTGKVLYLDIELHSETLCWRFDKISTAMDLPDEWRQNVVAYSLRGKTLDLITVRPLLEAVGTDFDVVILDALYRFYPEGVSENENAQMTRLYNQIDEYAEMMGAGFVLVHHSTKGDQSGKRTTDVGSGGNAIARATDTHLVIRDHEADDCAVLDAELRSFQRHVRRTLRFDFPIWSVDGSTPAVLADSQGKKKSAEDDAKRQDLLHHLNGNGAMTRKKLRAALKCGTEVLERAIYAAERRGEIELFDSKSGGKTVELVRLIDTETKTVADYVADPI